MVENVAMAQELGYLDIPPGTLVKLGEVNKLPPDKVVIIATGSQGEPTAALARIAEGTHKQIKISPGDMVILSAHPIPGNEEGIHRIINRLLQRGAEVLYDKIAPVHVSGHASQEEQKFLINLVRPRYFIPVHGELRHLRNHARLAEELGIPPSNIFVVENGQVIEFTRKEARLGKRIPGGYVFVDGAGVGDIGPAVLKERERLAQDGFVVVVLKVERETGKLVGEPEIITKGFIYVREAEELMKKTRAKVAKALKTGKTRNSQALENRAREVLTRFFYEEIKRRPMIIPVVVEV